MDRDWAPFELHTHTIHSDGAFSVDELFDRARACGYRGIALTDHNTSSALPEALAAAERTGVALLPGMEWTTFFGHVLLWGDRYFDWRAAGPGDLAEALRPVRSHGSIVGAAHPFRPGNPFCTGCYWEYDTDWTDIDYIEVWSGLDPSRQPFNLRALALWKNLLNQGFRIRALSGRDWHRDSGGEARAAASFLSLPACAATRLPSETSRLAMDALKEGRVAVSCGPVPELTINKESSGVVIQVRVRGDIGWGLKISELTDACLRIDSNLGCLSESSDPIKGIYMVVDRPLSESLRWVNAELRGRISGDPEGEEQLIAFCNPEFI